MNLIFRNRYSTFKFNISNPQYLYFLYISEVGQFLVNPLAIITEGGLFFGWNPIIGPREMKLVEDIKVLSWLNIVGRGGHSAVTCDIWHVLHLLLCSCALSLNFESCAVWSLSIYGVLIQRLCCVFFVCSLSFSSNPQSKIYHPHLERSSSPPMTRNNSYHVHTASQNRNIYMYYYLIVETSNCATVVTLYHLLFVIRG